MWQQYWPSVVIPSSVLSFFASLYFVYTRYISRCYSWVGWVITIVIFRRRSYFVQMFENIDGRLPSIIRISKNLKLHQLMHFLSKYWGGANPIFSPPPKKLHHKMHTTFLNIGRLVLPPAPTEILWVQPSQVLRQFRRL